MPTIILLYAGLLGLMSIVLAAIPGTMRGKTGISVGDGGNPEMLLAMRRHANFVEVVPLALVLIGYLEMNQVSPYAIHGLGAFLVFARVCHAVGLKGDTISGAGRTIGAAGSALTVAVASVWCIVEFISL